MRVAESNLQGSNISLLSRLDLAAFSRAASHCCLEVNWNCLAQAVPH